MVFVETVTLAFFTFGPQLLASWQNQMLKYTWTWTLVVAVAAIWNIWMLEEDGFGKRTKFFIIVHWLMVSITWMCHWETTQVNKLLASREDGVRKEMSTMPKLFLKIDIQLYQLLLINVVTVLLIMCCNSSSSNLCRNNAQLMSKLSLMH